MEQFRAHVLISMAGEIGKCGFCFGIVLAFKSIVFFLFFFKELESSLPEPDLQPVVEELTYLKKNIFKSLPSCRLSSKTDSAAFNKATVHLAAFKVSAGYSQQYTFLYIYCMYIFLK